MDQRYPTPGEVLVGFAWSWAAHALFPGLVGRWQLADGFTPRRFLGLVLVRTASNAVGLMLVVPAVRRWSDSAKRRREELAVELGHEPTAEDMHAEWTRRYEQRQARQAAKKSAR